MARQVGGGGYRKGTEGKMMIKQGETRGYYRAEEKLESKSKSAAPKHTDALFSCTQQQKSETEQSRTSK